ncbi:luciferase family protein [Haladaptatus sp. GCM10025707]|uniref:luciferase domain-containing protein n=1 Tax=unclassified Haladaptatus TaxID=2622732 RepID=UPI0023E7C7F3|nr:MULTISPECIES: luciferase family protein [unclassified Haladaptatus]
MATSSPHLDGPLASILETVTGWPGVTAESHRFGGVEFQLAGREIGHIHRNGMTDIPYPKRLRDALVEARLTGPHHLFPDAGWTTFYVTDAAGADRAVWLLRANYLYYALIYANKPGHEALTALDFEAELAALDPPAPAAAIYEGLLARR